MFLQSIYHPKYALCDAQTMTYINSHKFRRRGFILRGSL